MKNVMVVIDTRNIMWCLNKAYGYGRLNYGAYMAKAVSPDDVLFQGIAYLAQSEEQSISFATVLNHLALNVKYKPPIKKDKRTPEDEVWFQHVDLDVMLTIDVMKLVATQKVDKLVIGSARSCLEDLITTVKRDYGVHTSVFACGVPKCIRRVADEVIDIPEDMLHADKKVVLN